MKFEVKLEEDESTITVQLVGELDTHTADLMDTVVEQAAEKSQAKMILDLEHLTYLSSAGLRKFFQLRKILTKRDAQMLIVRPSSQIRRILEIVKAVPLESIFGSDDEIDAYLSHLQDERQ